MDVRFEVLERAESCYYEVNNCIRGALFQGRV